jgi:hypothetical protein
VVFNKILFKYIVDKGVDWNGRCETPVGAAGQVRPRRSDSDEEAHRPPHGKRASWSGNQLLSLSNSNKVYEISILILIAQKSTL